MLNKSFNKWIFWHGIAFGALPNEAMTSSGKVNIIAFDGEKADVMYYPIRGLDPKRETLSIYELKPMNYQEKGIRSWAIQNNININ